MTISLGGRGASTLRGHPSLQRALESPAVFAFGVCAGPSDKFERISQPGILASQEPDSLVMVLRGQQSIFAGYNQMIEQAVAADVEGLVLIHDDARLRDPEVSAKLRAL